jgi:hypothetical protein
MALAGLASTTAERAILDSDVNRDMSAPVLAKAVFILSALVSS